MAGPFTGRWGIDAPLPLDVAMVLAYFVTRTIGGTPVERLWFAAAVLVCIRFPASGLGLAAVVATYPQNVFAGTTPAVGLVGAAAVGFALEWLLRDARSVARSRSVDVVIVGALLLGVATVFALGHTMRALTREFAEPATLRWIQSAAVLAFLVLALRASSLGSRRALLLCLATLPIGLGIALVHAVAPTLITDGPLAWSVSILESARAHGPWFGPTRLGTVAAVVSIVAACLALDRQTRYRRLWGALAVLALTLLVLSFSRGGFLGLAVAGIAVAFCSSRRLGAAVTVLVAVAVAVLVPVLIAARLSASGGTLQALLLNDVGRFDAWLAGLRMIVDAPVLGHGFHSFPAVGTAYGAVDGLESAHFELIDLWSQAGLPAVAGFLAIVVGIAHAAVQRRHLTWARAALGALVVYVVASSFNVQIPYLAIMAPVWLVTAHGIAAPASALAQTFGMRDALRTQDSAQVRRSSA